VRGDHWAAWAMTTLSSGSSPRAWGPRATNMKTYEKFRFIPTCVGTTVDGVYVRFEIASPLGTSLVIAQLKRL
jgi:hypothetical protein